MNKKQLKEIIREVIAECGEQPIPTDMVAGFEAWKKQAPASPEVKNELKQSLTTMIREAVEEYRTKGALGKTNVNRTAPVKATGANYVKQGDPVNTVDVVLTGLPSGDKTLGEFSLDARLLSGKPDPTPLAKRVAAWINSNEELITYADSWARGIDEKVVATFAEKENLWLDDKLKTVNNLIKLFIDVETKKINVAK